MEGMAVREFRRGDMPRVLVTGASGYIGSVLMDELASSGYDLVGLDAGFYDNATLFHD